MKKYELNVHIYMELTDMDMFVYKGITFCNSCHMFSACVYLKCPYISYVGIQYIYFHSVCILDLYFFHNQSHPMTEQESIKLLHSQLT